MTVIELIKYLQQNIDYGRLDTDSLVCVSEYQGNPVEEAALANGIAIITVKNGTPFVVLREDEF